MPAKIRLQRRGKKGQPFYHIVIADGRAPRDGRFIEKIGFYNPLTKPAEIEINFESALSWLQQGAQPTDTVKAILHYKGVMYKNHLLKGVQKGAFTAEEAEEKFQNWLSEKETRIRSKKSEHELSVKEATKSALAHEQKVNESKAQALAKKYAREQKAAELHAEEVVEETPAEVTEATAKPVAEEIIAEAPVAAELVAEQETTSAEATSVEEEPTTEEPKKEEPSA